MVSLKKAYEETHTRSVPAKDSGYRFYSPEISRWLSKDPIGEDGGGNLYGFVGNGPVGNVDALGNYGIGVVTVEGGQTTYTMFLDPGDSFLYEGDVLQVGDQIWAVLGVYPEVDPDTGAMTESYLVEPVTLPGIGDECFYLADFTGCIADHEALEATLAACVLCATLPEGISKVVFCVTCAAGTAVIVADCYDEATY